MYTQAVRTFLNGLLGRKTEGRTVPGGVMVGSYDHLVVVGHGPGCRRRHPLGFEKAIHRGGSSQCHPISPGIPEISVKEKMNLNEVIANLREQIAIQQKWRRYLRICEARASPESASRSAPQRGKRWRWRNESAGPRRARSIAVRTQVLIAGPQGHRARRVPSYTHQSLLSGLRNRLSTDSRPQAPLVASKRRVPPANQYLESWMH